MNIYRQGFLLKIYRLTVAAASQPETVTEDVVDFAPKPQPELEEESVDITIVQQPQVTEETLDVTIKEEQPELMEEQVETTVAQEVTVEGNISYQKLLTTRLTLVWEQHELL